MMEQTTIVGRCFVCGHEAPLLLERLHNGGRLYRCAECRSVCVFAPALCDYCGEPAGEGGALCPACVANHDVRI